MPTKVIQANITHLSDLTSLFDAYRVFYGKPSDVESAETFLAERISNNESVVFIAEVDEVICGFTQLYPLFSSTRMKRLWLLNDLYVEANYRGRGVSKALMFAAQNHAKVTEAAGLMLETAKTNMIGNALYTAMNWELDNDHNYYSWDVK